MFDTLTIDQVREICPGCAKKMEEQNITSVKFQEGIKMFAPDGRPPKAWWDKCIASARARGGVTDLGAYCGWLWHHVVVEKGAKPGEVLTEDYVEEFKGTSHKSSEEVRHFAEDTYTLEDVEIFKVGTWNGDTYTQENIDAIVDNFWKLQGKVKPPVKIGHSERQSLLKKEGMPAAGWIEKLRKRGDTILATIRDIPKVVYDLLVKKAYNRVSSEIYPEYETEGKKYSPVLRAIAFLGADVPAIETIGDIEALYKEQGGNTTWYSFSQTQLKGGGGGMKKQKTEKHQEVEGAVAEIIEVVTEEAVSAVEEVIPEAVKETATEAIEEKKEEIKSEVVTEVTPKVEEVIEKVVEGGAPALAVTQEEGKDKIISDLKERIKELEDKLSKVSGEKTELLTEKKKSEIDSVINKAKQEGRLIPKMETALRTLMEQADDVKVVKFKEGDKEEELTQFEIIKRHIASIPNVVQFAEISKSGEKFEVKTSYQMPDGSLVPIKDGEMALKATKYSEEHNVPYAEAIVEVWKLSKNE